MQELRQNLANQWPGQYEIIVVDDGSTDGTSQELDQIPDIRVLRHRQNRGYGAAIKTGIRQAQGVYIATFDADGQHYPHDLLKLGQAIQEEDLALVIGVRSRLFHSNLWRMPGKWILGWLSNYLTKTKIPDLNSGLRIFKKDIISRYLHLCSDRFSFSTTSTLIFLNRGYALSYIPIEVKKRLGKSTVSFMSGYETFLLILRIVALFEPLRIFIPASIIVFMAGVLHAIYPFFVLKRGLSTGSLLVMLTGILIFFFGLLADQISALRKEKYE
ncbi:MAG: glycosyltransferase family 2 protein [Deltaproteobacteria bacterium]|nr:glycosyltransferase family 2 protein [Deltaproteobacteria bacterium]